ncbi:MAG TPA: ABC transporter ATP-binding protein [Jiangellaceae bacterium]
MTNAPPVLEIEHLTKDYRKGVRANDDITLQVGAGEVFGLLGHNGAGKTTLLNQVIGIAKPTSGTIRIDGRDAVADPVMARDACSMQPQTQAPLDGVSPREAIELMARLRGADRRRAKRRTAELIEVLDIQAWQDAKGERLSGGVQRLTAFAMAAAEPGRLVMFDEPTNDVDPVRRRMLWAEVRKLADQGCAVVLVTHNVVEAERAVDRLAILDHGRVVDQGTPSQLRGDHANKLRFEVTCTSAGAAAGLAERFTGIEPAVSTGRRMMVPIWADDCPAALTWAQDEQRAGNVDEFSFTPVSLEDIYIRLVGPEGNGNTEEVGDEALVA